MWERTPTRIRTQQDEYHPSMMMMVVVVHQRERKREMKVVYFYFFDLSSSQSQSLQNLLWMCGCIGEVKVVMISSSTFNVALSNMQHIMSNITDAVYLDCTVIA
jgi:hypothetical protein